jgi:16S rRNA (guanine1207-N2)-methyltransferase
VTAMALSAGTSEAALDALFHVFTSGTLTLPDDGRVLFLRARDGRWWHPASRKDWLFQQSFKPFADALQRSGLNVGEPTEDQQFPLVLVLPPRQRDEARALFARALRHVQAGGIVVAAVANVEGARSAEADFRQLVGEAGVLSKHKCRVFWSAPMKANVDQQRQTEWAKLDALRSIGDGAFVSRPGLFAWDRIDAASALLASQLPKNLRGRVADLGAGYGYLSAEIIRSCADVKSIDLYEAEARALEPARENMQTVLRETEGVVEVDVIWHDVTRGLPKRYDVIVSNPPFHQGRADQPELGQAFIAAAAKALEPAGQLWLVANRHLPYESILSTHFAEIETRVMRDGFKVIKASEVRV